MSDSLRSVEEIFENIVALSHINSQIVDEKHSQMQDYLFLLLISQCSAV